MAAWVTCVRACKSCMRGMDLPAEPSDHWPVPERPHTCVRVLVVDDAPSVRNAARHLLEQRGYVIAGEADSVASAMRAVEQLAPDAVLLDVHLPDGDGVELATELVRANPALWVLLMSAHDLDYRPYGGSRRPAFVDKADLAKFDFAQFWPPSGRSSGASEG